MTKRSLGIEDFAQAAIYQTRCEMEPLAGLLPMDCVSVESANELARTIREMPDGDPAEIPGGPVGRAASGLPWRPAPCSGVGRL